MIEISNVKSSHKVKKPWGYELWIANGNPNFKYVLKEIFFKAPYRTSLQVHQFKEETNYVQSGKGILFFSEKFFNVKKFQRGEFTEKEIDEFTQNLKKIEISSGSVIHVKSGCIHRIEAIEDLKIIEASSVELDDVIRLKDDTNRKHGKINSEHLGD